MAPTNAAAGGTHYYLALGDSLAQGYQPIDSYPPYYYSDAYVPLVYAALSADDPKLVLDNISCGGEGTVSMIEGSQPLSVGSSCGSPAFYQHWYPHKTQLAEAVNFLAAHKDKAEFVTIDIGGNDVAFCLFDAADLGGCLNNVFASLAANLDTILTQLRRLAERNHRRHDLLQPGRLRVLLRPIRAGGLVSGSCGAQFRVGLRLHRPRRLGRRCGRGVFGR
jgi:lysophospholipase L1-like esterase